MNNKIIILFQLFHKFINFELSTQTRNKRQFLLTIGRPIVTLVSSVRRSHGEYNGRRNVEKKVFLKIEPYRSF